MDWLVWLLLFSLLGIAFFGLVGLPWAARGCLALAGFSLGALSGLPWWGWCCVGVALGAVAALLALIRAALHSRREMDPDYSWLRQLLIALDQGVNALICGYADETISARCYRLQGRSRFWRAMCRLVDSLFARWESDHCFKSWCSEQYGSQLPPEYRVNKEACRE